MVFGLDMVYFGNGDETVPLWDYRMFNHQRANAINIGDSKMSNLLLSMSCSYFSIVTFFFFFPFCSFFVCSVQDVMQIWHVGSVVGVDTETGAKYNLNGLAAQEVVNELLLAEVEGRHLNFFANRLSLELDFY